MSEPAIFAARELRREFRHGQSRFDAVKEISFEIAPRTRLGIVGESGSGKTTLVRMLAGLLRPSSGELEFKGQSLIDKTGRELFAFRRAVQMVFQDPRSSLDPRMKIGQSITEPLRSPIWRDVPNRPDPQQRLAQVMSQVGLDPALAKRYPHQFSGGQRQRIAIARAIAGKPEVLIADEAVSALDVSVRAQVLNLLGDLVNEYGLTMIFVSHDLSVVRHICDQVMVLKAGEIVEIGSADQIYNDPQAPYTQQLLRSIPRLPRG